MNNLRIKKCFVLFTSITASFANYKWVGLCPARNDDKSANLTPIKSKYVSVDLSEQCLHILTNGYWLNWLNGSTKMQDIESLFKFHSHFYNVQKNYIVNHRRIKLRWKNKLFMSLNAINVKTHPYWSKGFLIHRQYRSYPTLGQEVVDVKFQVL